MSFGEKKSLNLHNCLKIKDLILFFKKNYSFQFKKPLIVNSIVHGANQEYDSIGIRFYHLFNLKLLDTLGINLK